LSKSIAIEPGLLELLRKVAGVRFFETQRTYQTHELEKFPKTTAISVLKQEM